MAIGLTATLGVALTTPVQAGLLINPVFSGSITTNSNSAAIEGAITTAIGTIDGLYSPNNVSVTVDFSYNPGASGNLLSTNQNYYGYSYSSYTAALAADSAANASNTTLATAVANLSKGNDSGGSSNLAITYAQALLLANYGLASPSAPSSNASINIASNQPFAFTTPVSNSSYDAIGGLEHELDEVLGGGGGGSTLNSQSSCSTTPTSFFCNKYGSTDLYRYSAPSTPSFSTSSTATSYFSINGGTSNIVAFNQNAGGDFGDFTPSCGSGSGSGELIQNAFNCQGQYEAYTAASPEFTMLEAIGYDSTQQSIPEPGSLLVFATGLAGLAVWARRRTL